MRTRLRRDGHYEASASARAAPGGTSPSGDPLLNLAITMVPGPLISLRFEGDPVPEARRADLVPVAREASVDEDLLEDSLRRIVQFLHDQGHWKAQVTYRRDTLPTGGMAVTFSIKAGEVFRVGAVDVEGAQALSRADIATVFKAVPGDVFVEGAVDSQTAALVERYRRAGFRDVRIEQVAEERDAAAARGGRTSGLVDIRLVVTEGALVRVGTVRITGTTGVSEADLRRQADPDRGGAVLRAARRRRFARRWPACSPIAATTAAGSSRPWRRSPVSRSSTSPMTSRPATWCGWGRSSWSATGAPRPRRSGAR